MGWFAVDRCPQLSLRQASDVSVKEREGTVAFKLQRELDVVAPGVEFAKGVGNAVSFDDGEDIVHETVP